MIYFLCLLKVFVLILNVSILSYCELNISEAVLSTQCFFSGFTGVSDEVYDPVNLI